MHAARRVIRAFLLSLSHKWWTHREMKASEIKLKGHSKLKFLRLKDLVDAGISTLQDAIDLGEDCLRKIPGCGDKLCAALEELAQECDQSIKPLDQQMEAYLLRKYANLQGFGLSHARMFAQIAKQEGWEMSNA